MTACFHCNAPLDDARSPGEEDRLCASCGGRTSASDLAREKRFKRSTPLLAIATLAGVAGPMGAAIAMAPGATPGFSAHSLAMLALVVASFACVFAIPGWFAWRALAVVRPVSRVRWTLALFFGLSLAGMGVFAVGAGVVAGRLPAGPATPAPSATPP
jgi:hypothetical protein